MNFFAQILKDILLTSGLSAALTYLIIRLFRWLQQNRSWFQQHSIPVYGGAAIYLSFWVSFFIGFPQLLFNSAQWGLFLASTVVLLTGLVDDTVELNPFWKSAGILIGANIAYFMADIQFTSDILPNMAPVAFTTLSYLLTMAWIYMVTNALNLLDGLDGLASSVSVTSLVTLAVITFFFSLSIRIAFLMMLLLLAAAIIGFLPFNWPPAKIYLGDTGALLIGFMYAVLTVNNLKNATLFSFIIPLLLYAVPLFDTIYAMFRRWWSGKSITEADEDHVHHRLLRSGLTQTRVIIIMIGVTLFFSVLAILSQLYQQWRPFILLLAMLALILMIVSMNKLGDSSQD